MPWSCGRYHGDNPSLGAPFFDLSAILHLPFVSRGNIPQFYETALVIRLGRNDRHPIAQIGKTAHRGGAAVVGQDPEDGPREW
jgi:hypothetical protein